MNSKVILKKILVIYAIFLLFILIYTMEDGICLDNNHANKTITLDFEIIESSRTEGYSKNVDLINLNLPNPSWSIEDIELNFTNVVFGIETKIIEDNPTNFATISKFVFDSEGLGVQIKIEDPTAVYSVELYGNNESSEVKPIYVQIFGFNNATNIPNTQAYSLPLLLNMPYSLTPDWHLQNFSNPVFLPPGDYYLTIDGTAIGNSPNSIYKWYFNDDDPKYPDLYSSSYASGSWAEGIQGTPFLYKLNQKVNQSIFPEEINMSAQINGESYKVSNGNARGKGYLKKNKINYHPNNKTVKIKVKNNKTEKLEFNLFYTLNITNIFKALGSVNIRNNNTNEWSINPEITKVSDYHRVKFNYPKSWNNLQILKNGIDISSNITIDPTNYSIMIPNNIIENDSSWEILASSPAIEFNINAPKLDYLTGQKLSFSITQPLEGNYTFLLIDPLGLEEYQTTKEIPSQGNSFSYTLPSNAIEGDYIAYVFWHNRTDAGVQSQVFSISLNNALPTGEDFSLYLILGLILLGGVVIGGSSYVTVKKVRSNRRDKLKQILEQCNDVLNLKYVIVLDTKTGIDLFAQSFEEKELDPTLISGFLQAIHNFGVEVIDGAKDSRTVKVEYKNSYIIMTEFINLRLIVIMKSNPSKNFLYAIESLAYHIYKYYGKLIDKFEGNLKPFRSIQKLIDSDLNTSIRYPLRIALSKDIKLNQEEKDMIKKASTFMKENNFDYFYAVYLLPDNVCGPRDYETILDLIKKGIFQPNKQLK